MSDQNPNEQTPPPQPEGGWQQVHNPPPPGYQQQQQGYPPPGYPQPSQPMAPNVAATVAYITFIGAICMLVMEPYKRSPFVRFHAWQCLILSGASILVSVVFAFSLGFGMWGMWFAIHTFLRVVIFVAWLIAIIKAYQNEWFKLPVAGDIAENLSKSVNI